MADAVFLDRDGVLNELVLNPATGEYEPPHRIGDMKLFPYVFECLGKIQNAGYDLFLVSNQPDYAKGKTTLEALEKVHNKFDQLLTSKGIYFKEYYYCYHHPQGIIPEYSYECMCRKPKPFFLFKAEENYNIELGSSWMIGDRDIDIECGKAAGTKTILIEEPLSMNKRGNSMPDHKVKDLIEAVEIIIQING
ncbi:MAG: HAD-IIIA family hydrolase [Candidatus Methanoperedens sp.]|nr:HAD-IIIA family hydrolase [Candidatus Methanoperedens sp.]MCZ7394895.1 HAD-IIIA family hydrolase [Candidatus Methanoperedens sp.]